MNGNEEHLAQRSLQNIYSPSFPSLAVVSAQTHFSACFILHSLALFWFSHIILFRFVSYCMRSRENTLHIPFHYFWSEAQKKKPPPSSSRFAPSRHFAIAMFMMEKCKFNFLHRRYYSYFII